MTAGRSYLRSVCTTGDVAGFVRVLPSLFTSDETNAYTAVRQHFDQYQTLPDIETLTATGIVLPRAPEPATYYLDRMVQRATYNVFGETVSSANQLLQGRDLGQVADLFRGALDQIGQYTYESNMTPVSAAMREAFATMQERRISQAMGGVPTGWQSLDTVTDGFLGGDLALLIGRPSVGKTYALLHSALTAHAADKRCYLVSPEMTSVALARRLLAMRAGYSMTHLLRGQVTTAGLERLEEALAPEELGDTFMLNADPTSLTIETVEAAAESFAPDILFIDSGNLLGMAASGRQMRGWERIEEVAKRLKALAVSRNIPVVMTAHVVRNAGRDPNTPLDLSDIAGGEVYPRLASVAVAITIPAGADGDTQREHTLIKNRDGVDAQYRVQHEFDGMNFGELPAGAWS